MLAVWPAWLAQPALLRRDPLPSPSARCDMVASLTRRAGGGGVGVRGAPRVPERPPPPGPPPPPIAPLKQSRFRRRGERGRNPPPGSNRPRLPRQPLLALRAQYPHHAPACNPNRL